ncbi:uncharacterized protein LOC142973237 [Anticarsia gemmatalis]|uniref:uncharacterized protein LOC142973237 n=1 Tax=Anticarsia gemmatalis TaxID=129554 RepID=UPI003F76A8CD
MHLNECSRVYKRRECRVAVTREHRPSTAAPAMTTHVGALLLVLALVCSAALARPHFGFSIGLGGLGRGGLYGGYNGYDGLYGGYDDGYGIGGYYGDLYPLRRPFGLGYGLF